MDECLIYEGSICHHRCVNTAGSYRCECLPGYALQEDAFTCAQGKSETPPASRVFYSGDVVARESDSVGLLLFEI